MPRRCCASRGLLADGLADFSEKLAAESATEQLTSLMGCDATAGDEQTMRARFFDELRSQSVPGGRSAPMSSGDCWPCSRSGARGRRCADRRLAGARGDFQSPNLLYRTELGAPDATTDEVPVTPAELASELSYLVTLGPPDAELTRAAAAGELSQADAREAQARRLLMTPSARGAVAAFADDWLDIAKLPTLAKDPALFPSFSADSARAMQQDTQTLFNQVVFDGDGKLRSLLLGGLLTQPSVLASHAGSQLELAHTSRQVDSEPILVSAGTAAATRLDRDGAARHARCDDAAAHVDARLRSGLCGVSPEDGSARLRLRALRRRGRTFELPKAGSPST